MNVAMLGNDFINWTGGIDFLRAYARPLTAMKDMKVFLFFPIETKKYRFLRGILKRLLRKKKSTNVEVKDLINIFRQENNIRMVGYDYNHDYKGLIKKLRECNIDVVFPTMVNLGRDFPIPWVPYVYDFQHKYYPEFFTKKEILNRNRYFRDILQNADVAIVEAEDVKKDIKKYYPEIKTKVFVMPYTAIPEKDWFSLDNAELSTYRLPQKYFMISNQFWVHKSHITAFEALALLEQDGYVGYDIVCTGNTYDYRFPEYFSNIKRKIKELGIENRVHFLGYIPKLHQIKIMKESIAVIQPTLFEGNPGGGSAYNAVAMGIPIILSDIAVNRELHGDSITFFQAKSAENLKKQMLKFIECPPRRPSRDILEINGNKCLLNLEHAIKEVLKFCTK